MADNEGVRRLQLLGTRIAVWGGLAGILLWCLVLFFHSFGLGELTILLGLPTLFGGILWIIGWVIEGFFLSRD